MTKEEFDNLPTGRQEKCPVCGQTTFHVNPECGCEVVVTGPDAVAINHINRFHHVCGERKVRFGGEFGRLL